MKKFLLILCFLFLHSYLQAHEITQANSESEISAVVEGVNTITGSYSFVVPLHHVPGAQPITYYQSFNSHDYLYERQPFWSRSYYGFLFIFEKKIDKVKHSHARYIEDGGATTFLIEPSKKKNLCLKLSHDYSPTRGVTNTSQGVISATTNMSNMTLELQEGRKDKNALLTKPDGTLQNFVRYRKENHLYEFLLQNQTFPNGNRCELHHNDKGRRLATTFTNADRSTVFLEEHVEDVYYDKKRKLSYLDRLFSDGHKISQARVGYHSYNDDQEARYTYLQWTTSSLQPRECYEYNDYEFSRYARLSKRSTEDHRYTCIDYFDEGSNWVYDKWVHLHAGAAQIGRIKRLKAPAGTNEAPLTIYSFEYTTHEDPEDATLLMHGDTWVIDGNRHRKRYIYDKNHRLTHIYDVGLSSEPYRFDIFNWGAQGKLQHRRLEDHTHHSLYSKCYTYDDFGNVLKEEAYGSFTGESRNFRENDGVPIDSHVECRTLHHTYASAPFHSLLTTDNGKLLTRYSYLNGTNLALSKITTDHQHIQIREFYTYDKNKALVGQIRDNGTGDEANDLTGVTHRTIKKITPRMEGTGIGLPIIEELYGYDLKTLQEERISKVVNHYDLNYKLTKQDVYDNQDAYSYSLIWIYDNAGNLIQEIDANGNASTYAYDANYNRIHQLSASGQKEFFYRYDFMNRLVQKELKDPQGHRYTTTYQYDVMGNLTAEIDAYGNTTEFIYDGHNRCVEILYPQVNQKQPRVYKDYDHWDNVVCETDAQGNKTHYRFNSCKQVTGITYPDGSEESMRYYIDGTLAEKREKNGTKKCYQYDALGRMLEERI